MVELRLLIADLQYCNSDELFSSDDNDGLPFNLDHHDISSVNLEFTYYAVRCIDKDRAAHVIKVKDKLLSSLGLKNTGRVSNTTESRSREADSKVESSLNTLVHRGKPSLSIYTLARVESVSDSDVS